VRGMIRNTDTCDEFERRQPAVRNG